jgi:HlyD family secretion protein
MLQPRQSTVRDPGAAPPPPKSPTASGRTDRQLGDRVKSLSLANLPERQNTIWTNLAWLAGLAAVGLAVWYYISSSGAAKPEVEPASARSKAPRTESKAPASETTALRPVEPPSTSRTTSPVSVVPPAAPNKRDVVLEAKGYIIPAHQILVSPKVTGMIVQFNVEEGRRFNKGDVLAVLESTDYAADLQRVEANVRLMRERLRELTNGNRPEEIKEAEADLQEAMALVPQLEAEYKRNNELRRRSSATQQEVELAESKYFAQIQRVQKLQYALKLMQLGPREERIEIAKAELAQAEAEVVKAKWRLGNCTIVAPVTGTILKKNAEEGNVVNPGAMNGSFSLCDMADLSDLEVELYIQERDISVVQVGQQCRVRAEAYPDRIYQGVVDRLMPIADRGKGAIPVRVKLRIPPDEEGRYLKPEMGAIVTFLNERATVNAAEQASAGQELPATAVQP